MSMIVLIEPGMIAVMEPFQKAQKRFQTALSNWRFSPPFWDDFLSVL